MTNPSQEGKISLYVIILVIALGIVGGWFVLSNGLVNLSFGSKSSPEQEVTSIDKSDPKWLWNYCVSEIKKLPKAPMEYTQQLDVKYNQASPYISNDWAKNLENNDSETCQILYEYDDEIAYPSVGVEYKFDIKYGNQFTETIANLYHNSMPKGWERLTNPTDQEAGRPGYSSDALPMVYKRETPDTIEYLEVFDAIGFYVELTVYEK
jgi:hypothetical protein